jgi:hypothetical protein
MSSVACIICVNDSITVVQFLNLRQEMTELKVRKYSNLFFSANRYTRLMVM